MSNRPGCPPERAAAEGQEFFALVVEAQRLRSAVESLVVHVPQQPVDRR